MLIGDVAQRSGVSVRMLRHYDKIGVLRPSARTTGDYRVYSDGDVERLFQIESLRSLGLSLAEVAVALADSEYSPADLLDRLIVGTEERLAEEENLLRRLREVRTAEPQRWADVVHLLPLLRGLQSASPVRRQLSALGMNDDDASRLARPLAEAVLAESQTNTAGALRWALRRTGDAALGALLTALDDTDPVVRRRAAQALADLESEAATAALTTLLDDTDAQVRQRAALAVGPRGSDAARPVLLRMVIDAVADVEAAEALGALAAHRGTVDEVAEQVIAELDRRPVGDGARLRLAQTLAELPGAPALAALRRLREDGDPNVARSAIYLVRLATRA